MRDILADLESWHKQNKAIALATVVNTWGSAPRAVGAKMAMTADGLITGSVSGGCVEAAVFEAGVETLRTGQAQLLHYGVADETAWQVGLACGGNIDVFVQRLPADLFELLRDGLHADTGLTLASVIGGPDDLLGSNLLIGDREIQYGSLSADLDAEVLQLVLDGLPAATVHKSMSGDLAEQPVEIFLDVMPAARSLVIVGGVHIAIGLAEMGKLLGYRIVVVDPRGAFGSEERFPDVDQLINAWPMEAFSQINITPSTAIVMLTHDPKIDDPALKISLNSTAFYVGALGSRSTQAKRVERLKQAGMSATQIERLHGPVGLDIGAKSPQEIALAIMAEITAAQPSGN